MEREWKRLEVGTAVLDPFGANAVSGCATKAAALFEAAAAGGVRPAALSLPVRSLPCSRQPFRRCVRLNCVFVGPALWVNPKQGIFDLKAADTGGVHVLRSKISRQQSGVVRPPALSRPVCFLPCATCVIDAIASLSLSTQRERHVQTASTCSDAALAEVLATGH
jgi:hypothetical protein